MISTTGLDLGTLLLLELDLTPALGTSQSTFEDGLGGLLESPEHPTESSAPSFSVWVKEKGERYLIGSQRQ